MGKKKKKRLFINKSKFTSALIIGCIAAVVIFDYVSREQKESPTAVPREYTKGNPEAGLKILEFIDVQCSECARGTELIDRYIKQHPSEIFLAARLFPLNQPNSILGSKYAECAARQDKFWPFLHLVFSAQARWRPMSNPESVLRALARTAKVDIQDLQVCLNDPKTHTTILNAKAYGEARFVTSTPTYYINKELVVGVEALEKTMKKYFNEL